MPDTSMQPGPDDDPNARMVLLRINESYWLSEGAEYLNPMLMGGGYFPTPILCINFEDSFALRIYLGPDQVVTDFWGVNPDIVERLRRDGHLTEQDGPDE